jgi:hypothetical protein
VAPDPIRFKNEADDALERAADRLRRLLGEACARLDPFPPFPGAFFSFGIEIDAPAVESSDRGCVVLAQDGELYELEMRQDLPDSDMEIADPVALRDEKMKALDLHPLEYVVYAYEALRAVTELLLERESEGEDK